MAPFEKLVSWENLVRAAWRARRRKPKSQGLLRFEANREVALAELRAELMAGTYRPGPPRSFRIHDPKSRLISAAPYRDRVVHHALVQVLEPLWERAFLHHSYACRKGKGTHRALDACTHFARRFPWVLRADVAKFYRSMDHAVLRGLLARRVRDPRVLSHVDRILAAGGQDRVPPAWFSGDDLFTPLDRERGLPIGSLTSQFFANVYLDAVDHRMTDELGFGAHVRYMDDILVFAPTKERACAAAAALEAELAAVRLRLHPGKRNLMPVEGGIPFLGFRVFPHHRRLRTVGKVRQVRRLRALTRAFAAGCATVASVRASVMALRGHALAGNTYHWRTSLVRKTSFRRSG